MIWLHTAHPDVPKTMSTIWLHKLPSVLATHAQVIVTGVGAVVGGRDETGPLPLKVSDPIKRAHLG